MFFRVSTAECMNGKEIFRISGLRINTNEVEYYYKDNDGNYIIKMKSGLSFNIGGYPSSAIDLAFDTKTPSDIYEERKVFSLVQALKSNPIPISMLGAEPTTYLSRSELRFIESVHNKFMNDVQNITRNEHPVNPNSNSFGSYLPNDDEDMNTNPVSDDNQPEEASNEE